jgi:guanylate kinase
VKSSKLPCKYVFIAPPSMEVLENRLRNRGTESEESILIRLATASEELQYGVTEGNFDAVIVNNDIETAVAEIIKHLRSSYPTFDFDTETNVSN